MGMFDAINYEMSCPICGEKVDGFQSKDGECVLANIDYWEVDNFYTSCPKCDAWIEFTRSFPKEKVPITDYKLVVIGQSGEKNDYTEEHELVLQNGEASCCVRHKDQGGEL